ncbi:MAG: leucine-rich repeat protein [Oscillospiraceae bacterium]|nr:leucine-rich repeat protein [Oscillospiraceae bacterium]
MIKKRILSTFLAIALLASVLTVFPAAETGVQPTATGDFVIENGFLIKYNGSGGDVEHDVSTSTPAYKTLPNFIAPIKIIDPDDPEYADWIPISTAAELDDIHHRNANNKYYLINDIDLAGMEWMEWRPLGDGADFPFTGIFDGQGYVIRNMTITKAYDTDAPLGRVITSAGLFRHISGAEIRNVGLEDTYINVEADARAVGGVVGFAEGSLISNVYTTGSISLNSSGDWGYAGGGIVGIVDDWNSAVTTSIKFSYNAADVSGNVVGGIVGDYYGGGTVYGCFNTGNITGNELGSYSIAGGIAGHVEGALKVEQCFNAGTVSAVAYAAGIVASLDNPGHSILDCYNIGDISIIGEVAWYNADGIFAVEDEEVAISKVYSSGIINDEAETALPDFAGFDFENVWAFLDGVNDGMPVLRVFERMYTPGPSDWEYQWYYIGLLNDTYQAEITAYNGVGGDVIIPSELDGYEVVSVWMYALSGQTNITSVVIPETVIELDHGAFSGCTSLATVTFMSPTPPHMYKGDDEQFAFENCADVITVYVPRGSKAAYEIAFSDIQRQNIGDFNIVEIGDEPKPTHKTLPNFIAPISIIDPDGPEYADRIAISDRAGLEAINDNLSGNYYLTSDIDLSGEDWTPLGSFTGVFDGQGYVIRNMTIEVMVTEIGYQYDIGYGLFEIVKGRAIIRNLGLEDTDIKVNETSLSWGWGMLVVGGIAGSVENSIITNCYNTGNVVSYSSSNSAVGGLFGSANGSNIIGCYNTADVESDNYLSGGIVGYVYRMWSSDIGIIIDRCFNTGNIKGGWDSGGIVGGNDESRLTLSITNSYNTGDITSFVSWSFNYAGSGAGGIMGAATWDERTPGVDISDCYNTGTIHGGNITGGIIGSADGGGTIVSRSYNTGDVLNSTSSEPVDYVAAIGNFYSNRLNSIYWNIDSLQQVEGIPLSNDDKKGVKRVPWGNLLFQDTTIPLTTEQMQLESSFDGFDFEKTWTFIEGVNNDMPVLRAFAKMHEVEPKTPCIWDCGGVFEGLCWFCKSKDCIRPFCSDNCVEAQPYCIKCMAQCNTRCTCEPVNCETCQDSGEHCSDCCEIEDCKICNPPTCDCCIPEFAGKPGHVLGGNKVTIGDALEILKYLAKMTSKINSCENSFNAALIISKEKPAIGDVLEILKKLAGMLNRIDIPYWDEVKFEPVAVNLIKGGTHSINKVYLDENGKTAENISYVSMKEEIASVDSKGMIKSETGGSTQILVYNNERLLVVYRVIVSVPATSVRVTNTLPAGSNDFVVSMGQPYKFDFEVLPLDTTDAIQLTVAPSGFGSNRGEAQITPNGEMHGIAKGRVTLTVRAGNVVQTYSVLIYSPTTELNVTGIPTERISVGERYTINATKTPQDSDDGIEFSVSDNSKLRIVNPGNRTNSTEREIVAASQGNVTLTVKSGNISKSFDIIVEAPVISSSKLDLVHGSPHQFSLAGTVRQVSWSSSNPGVATIDQNGHITTLNPGYTCIIAKVGNSEYYSDVRVISELESRISNLQNKYPDGYFWNNHTPSSLFPNVSEQPCVNHPQGICRGQCAGYANLISNEIFGAGAPRHRVPDVASVKPGDYIRYGNPPNGRHSIIVIAVINRGDIIGYNRNSKTHILSERPYWIITDCNWMRDCGIDWYRRFDYEQVFATSGGLLPNLSYSRY